MMLGTVLVTIPASQLMARVGRRAGYVVGAALGTLSAAVAAWGIFSNSLALLSQGALLIGAYIAFAQF